MQGRHEVASRARTLIGRAIATRRRTWCVAVAQLVAITLLALGLQHFRMEANSDAIVLDDDLDLRFYDVTREIFGSDAELIVAVQPKRTVFDRRTLEELGDLVADLFAIEGTQGVTSLLSVPLFQSPPVGLLQLASGYKTLSDPEIDLGLARAEVLSNPLYLGALISKDESATVLVVRLEDDEELARLENERYRLRDALDAPQPQAFDRRELRRIEQEYKDRSALVGDLRRQQIRAVRAVLRSSESTFERIELGGVPMIAADIVDYVERDILNFGIAVLLVVLLTLGLILRSWKWTLLCTFTSTATILALTGLLGWLDWRTTIVTSNMPSLLFIVTTAMTVHFAVRYKEQRKNDPGASQVQRTLDTVAHVWPPTLFTAITTVVGFASLYTSGIRPVMDFALMMALGIGFGLLLTFSLLPTLALLWPDSAPACAAASHERRSKLAALAEFSLERPVLVIAATGLCVLGGVTGLLRLTVENRFMDYFSSSTPIHRGMIFLDQTLGGTTPLEIVIELDDQDAWLKPENLVRLRQLHQWLETQPEVGKVTSLDSMVRVVEQILRSDPSPLFQQAQVNEMMLRTLRSRVPEQTARLALRPYVDAEYSKTRVLTRVNESDHSLDRQALLQRLDEYLAASELAGRARPTGMFVLYNNMLQSLFRSQIQTIAVVFLAIGITFWLLMRSLRLSAIAVVPNILPTLTVLGLIGWTGIPLNMMTIMVAAVTLGIAVDDTTHYLYRYRKEWLEAAANGAPEALEIARRCHSTVGTALVTTTLAIAVGFSVLSLSNFLPTVQFGLLVGFAMFVALAADLLLLPLLLRLFWNPAR